MGSVVDTGVETQMNQLYHGDNLSILRDMPSESVDLICTDPPFNTGKDWGAFNDKWEGGLKGYLKFMEQRVIECRRVLKGTGSLYLHCDPTASHYLKVMLDTVFGIKQFQNEIVWYYKNASRGRKRLAKAHDAIFWYSKTSDFIFNVDEIRMPFDSQMTEWRYKQPKYKNKTKPNGKIPDDVITMANINNMAKERLGYPTQKPVALYERMIKASSNQGDVVLDPFAGSGTTLDAAHALGRHWIGIDESSEAINVIQKRMESRHSMLLEYEMIRQ